MATVPIECPDCDAELSATVCSRGGREPTEADLEVVRYSTLTLHRQLVHGPGGLEAQREVRRG